MERTVVVDGREVRLRTSAAIPRMYRMKFHRDIIQDMRSIQKSMGKAARKRGGKSIPVEALEMFENMAYLMARHADPQGVPDSVGAWLDEFETFSIYDVFPVILEMWEINMRTSNEPKKKSRRQRGR